MSITSVRLAPLLFVSSLIIQADEVDLAMRSWRIQTKNATVVAEREFEGRSPVWRVDYVGDRDDAVGEVSLAAYSPRQMLDSWIPPYVLRDAEQVAFEIRLQVGTARVAFQKQNLDVGAMDTQAWTKVSLPLVKNHFGLAEDLSFRMRGKGNVRFRFANLKLFLEDGRVYEVLHERAPRYTDMMPVPLAKSAVKPLPRRPRIQFGVANLTCLALAPQWTEIGRFMAKYLPEYDIVLSEGGTPPLKLGEVLKTLPENLFVQFQKGQHDLRYAKLKDALVRNRFGESQSWMFNSTVATDPVLRDAYEEQIAYAGSLGFNNIQQYDYVWMYGKGGPWCFDKSTIAAFREDLLGLDEGLHLGASDVEPAKTIHFEEYYAYAHGSSVKPSDLGLSDWSTYEPKWKKGPHERMLYTLMAYEWLRQAQRFGAWSRKYCYGTPYDYLLNGEGEWNGNDHCLLPRLVDTGIVYDEHFDGSFQDLPAIYRGVGCAVRNAARYGKHWGVCVETSRGGGGNQPYFSARCMYTLGYVFAALGYDAIEYDGFPGSNFWHNNGSLAAKRNARNMLDHMMATARGYRQARIDGMAKRRDFKALHVVERRFAGTHQGNCFFGMHLKGDLRTEIDAAAIDCEMIDVQELPLLADKADAIFVSPLIKRRDTLDFLAQWQAAKPGRVLVTKPEEVTSTVDRLGLRRLQVPSETNDVLVLPFGRVGVPPPTADGDGAPSLPYAGVSVAVLVNRRATAVAHARMAKWFKEVWPVGLWNGPCDPAKVLFKDDCPECAVEEVRVPVANGVFRVYDFFDDREHIVEAKGGVLPLPLGSKFTKLHYYAPDTPAFREFLAKVKSGRALSSEFLK